MLNFIFIFLLNSLFWIFAHLISGYIVLLIPDNFYNINNFLFKIKIWGKEYFFYKNILKINNWKNKLPEGGEFYKIKPFNKKKLEGKNINYLYRYLLETCRGELAHLLPFLFYPISIIWNSFLGAIIMFLFCLFFNLPFIFILRYNRIRIYKLIKKIKTYNINS
ncbi:MAG: hypothetical protein N3A58_08020 [Spirochaetes bacterium]|nr:hypothetical protein [Spirochaetota bacterium]